MNEEYLKAIDLFAASDMGLRDWAMLREATTVYEADKHEKENQNISENINDEL